MGVVYLAEDTTLSREVALKVLYPSLSTDTVFIERFKQEARAVASILHPNIVRINSFESIEHSHAIDMEYISGSSLSQMMADTVFTPLLAVQIARDTLEGMAICHGLGIVHRDIKPSNILLSVDGRAKLADFGLATAYAVHLESSIYKSSSTGFFMGTPRFAPPEAWEGVEPRPDWDLYSLGLVLYEGLTGKPVYDGNSPLAIVKQIMLSPLAPICERVPEVSPELGRLIDCMISREPSVRIPDASAALERLREAPEFKDSVGSDAPTVRTLVRSMQRKKKGKRYKNASARLLYGGFGAAALLAVIVMLWLGRDEFLRPAPNTPPPAPTVTKSQEEIGLTKLLTAQDIMDAPKTAAAAPSLVFNARYFNAGSGNQPRTDRSERWLLRKSGNQNSSRVIAISDSFLMEGELSDTDPDTVVLKGNWATYTVPSGAGFCEGTVEGIGGWNDRDKWLNISLKYTNTRDHSTESFTVSVSRAEDWKTESRFAYEIERAPLLQSLLFCELRQRGAAQWAGAIIDLLPSVHGATCVVPLIAQDMPVTVDGNLNEEIWTRPFFNKKGRVGSMTGFPRAAESDFKARATPTNVLLGMTSRNVRTLPFRVSIAILPITPGPITKQSFMSVHCDSDGKPEFYLYNDGVEKPWAGEVWQLSTAIAAGTLTCEIAIPVAGLSPQVAPGERVAWRVNACFLEKETTDKETVLAAWGFPDILATEHGGLLKFENEVSS
jgi:serine/threonine protein kinase